MDETFCPKFYQKEELPMSRPGNDSVIPKPKTRYIPIGERPPALASTYPSPFPDRWAAITSSVLADCYTKQRWPECFSNIEAHCQSGDSLYYEEINVILAVIDEILETVLKEVPVHGTFILDGHNHQKECECLLRFNLRGGPTVGQILPYMSNEMSDTLAAASIDHALEYPDKSSAFSYIQPLPGTPQLKTGIHGDDQPDLPYCVMVLNTTFGRFLASFYADFANSATPSYNPTTTVLVALATALSEMGKEDKVLQESVRTILNHYTLSIGGSPISCREAVRVTRRLFETCEHPVLAAWKEWHEPANGAGELSLFFD